MPTLKAEIRAPRETYQRNVTQCQDPYAMHTLGCQIYRKSRRIRASGQGAICRYVGLGVGFGCF